MAKFKQKQLFFPDIFNVFGSGAVDAYKRKTARHSTLCDRHITLPLQCRLPDYCVRRLATSARFSGVELLRCLENRQDRMVL